jgi:hypothetical protein
MIRPRNPKIAIIVLVAMAGVFAVRQAQGQPMPAAAPAAGTPADTGGTKATDRQEAKSASTGSSSWRAGGTSFAPQAKGGWGGSQSSTPKPAWTTSSSAFSDGAVQPGGVWRTRPSSSAPEGATSTNSSEVESVSAVPAASRMSKSSMGTRQFGIGARKSTMGPRQFGMPPHAAAGSKPAFGNSGQSHSFTATRPGGIRSTKRSRSGSGNVWKHGTNGLGPQPGAPDPGLGQHRLGSGTGGTGSDFDPHP